MAQVNIRIDDKLRDDGNKLFDELGLSFSTAVGMFVAQAVREQGIPFRVTARRTSELALASERALSKDWAKPEEDEAWRDL